MRYSLRTLVVVMILGGPLCAAGWCAWERWYYSYDVRLPPQSGVLIELYPPWDNEPPRAGGLDGGMEENPSPWTPTEWALLVVAVLGLLTLAGVFLFPLIQVARDG